MIFRFLGVPPDAIFSILDPVGDDFFIVFLKLLYNIRVDVGKVFGSLPPILEAAAIQKNTNEILISKYFPMSYWVPLIS